MFDWKPQYSVPIPSIDGQHQNLIRIAEELYAAMSAGQGKAALSQILDRLVQYTTPPNRAGLGTAGMLEVSDLPVKGLTILNLASDANALTEVRVRLPAGLNAVAAAIVQLETTCVQLSRGCRGLP